MPGPAKTETPVVATPAPAPPASSAPGPDAEWFYLDTRPLSEGHADHAESYFPVTSR